MFENSIFCSTIRCLKNLDFYCMSDLNNITPNDNDRCIEFTRTINKEVRVNETTC